MNAKEKQKLCEELLETAATLRAEAERLEALCNDIKASAGGGGGPG